VELKSQIDVGSPVPPESPSMNPETGRFSVTKLPKVAENQNGYYHNLEDNKLKKLLVIPLLKITRYFSYSDEKIHKLYKSKYAKKKVEG
jgi:hypothetical protein